MSERILVVDDDPGIRFALSEALKKRGYEVSQVGSAEEALNRIKLSSFDLMLLDVRLPGMSGIEAIPRVREMNSDVEIIVITAHGSKDVALDAIRRGAYDYFTKPFSLGEMEIIIRRALEKRRLQAEIRELRERLGGSKASRRIIGQSDAAKLTRALVDRIAPLDTTVLITGESGTGKELIADVIHAQSRRASGPFVKINCAAIPEALLESELFGHEKGAFTGALSRKAGKFELADKGSILLDEIGDMPLNLQAKLLRVVGERQVERVGSAKPFPVDVRLIASTNQDLSYLISEKQFREDLYYRLNVASIHLAPLRERKEDIPLLVQHFILEINLKLGTNLSGICREAMEMLLAYHWPGNVREFANILERAAILSTGTMLSADEVFTAFQKSIDRLPNGAAECAISLNETLEEVEKSLLINALEKTGGVQSEAAGLLGLSPKNLWKKIKKHGIEARDYTEPPAGP